MRIATPTRPPPHALCGSAGRQSPLGPLRMPQIHAGVGWERPRHLAALQSLAPSDRLLIRSGQHRRGTIMLNDHCRAYLWAERWSGIFGGRRLLSPAPFRQDGLQHATAITEGVQVADAMK